MNITFFFSFLHFLPIFYTISPNPVVIHSSLRYTHYRCIFDRKKRWKLIKTGVIILYMSLHESTNKRIVVKIGSSSLTSRLGDISRHKLERIVDEVVALKDEGYEVLLVSSGAVAAGYRRLGCLNRPTSLAEKQAAASIGQGLLMEAYSERFISHGYTASQILITRSDFSDRDRYHNARNTINVLLDRGIIPIVNENDTVTVERLKFGDNDTLSAKVAGLVDADQLVILSDIDGLYTEDPRKNPEAKTTKKSKGNYTRNRSICRRTWQCGRHRRHAF